MNAAHVYHSFSSLSLSLSNVSTILILFQDVHKMQLADYESKYGAPPEDDLDDIAADEDDTNGVDDIAVPEHQDHMWQQPVI